MRYLITIFYNSVKQNEKIKFYFNDGDTIEGNISMGKDGWYVSLYCCCNDTVFTKLGIDKYKFIHSIVGYRAEGGWPEVKTSNDLKKILDALLKVNKKTTIDTPQISEPSKVRINISDNNIKLNFKI